MYNLNRILLKDTGEGRRGFKKFSIADRNKITFYSAACNSCAQQRFRSRMLGRRRCTSHAWIRLIKWNCPSAVLRRARQTRQTVCVIDRQCPRGVGQVVANLHESLPRAPSSLDPREDRKDDKVLLNSLTVVTKSYCRVSYLESPYTIVHAFGSYD